MLTQTRVQAGDSPLLRSASFLDGIGHHDTDRFESSKDMSVDQCTPGALVAEVIIASRRLLRRTFFRVGFDCFALALFEEQRQRGAGSAAWHEPCLILIRWHSVQCAYFRVMLAL